MAKKKKKDRKNIENEKGKEFVGKTIVGGRARRRRRRKQNIPVGIEKILYKAAIDPDFKKTLLEDRSMALESQGIRLSPSEDMIFKNVQDNTLELMINQIRPEKHGKRRFMKAVAAAAVTLATGTAGVGCDDEGPPKDVAEEEDIYNFDIPEIGITPEIPEDIAEEDGEDALEDAVEDTLEDAQEDAAEDAEDAAEDAEDAAEDAEDAAEDAENEG